MVVCFSDLHRPAGKGGNTDSSNGVNSKTICHSSKRGRNFFWGGVIGNARKNDAFKSLGRNELLGANYFRYARGFGTASTLKRGKIIP